MPRARKWSQGWFKVQIQTNVLAQDFQGFLSFKGKKTGGFLRYRLGCLDALKKMEKEEPQRYQEIRFPELLMLLPGKYPK